MNSSDNEINEGSSFETYTQALKHFLFCYYILCMHLSNNLGIVHHKFREICDQTRTVIYEKKTFDMSCSEVNLCTKNWQ